MRACDWIPVVRHPVDQLAQTILPRGADGIRFARPHYRWHNRELMKPRTFFIRRGLVSAISFCATLATASADAPIQAGGSQSFEFFEKNIRPVLVERCYKCHSAESKKVK